MAKYLVTLKSGRNFIMNSTHYAHNSDNAEDVAWQAEEEAALYDDYLQDLRYISD